MTPMFGMVPLALMKGERKEKDDMPPWAQNPLISRTPTARSVFQMRGTRMLSSSVSYITLTTESNFQAFRTFVGLDSGQHFLDEEPPLGKQFFPLCCRSV